MLTRTSQDDVEVETVNSDRRIVLDAQVDVFLNTETEVSILREVLSSQLVFSDLKQIKKDLISCGTEINPEEFQQVGSLDMFLNICKQFSMENE